MNRPINAYLFDIGNVILSFDFNVAVEKLRKASPIVDSVGRQIQAEIGGERGRLARAAAELFFTKSSGQKRGRVGLEPSVASG